jgi:hypothetical protein
MTTINQHLDTARGNIRGDEELLRRILSQIPEQKRARSLLSPYVTYTFTSLVSVYAVVIMLLPTYNNYMLYREDNVIDSEFMALDLQADTFEQQMDVQDVIDGQTSDILNTL